MAKITAITGAPPCAVTDEHFDTARVAMTLAYTRRGKPTAGKNVAAVFHRLRLTLFHAGRLSTLRRPVLHPPVAVTGWATVAPGFAESAHRYVEQVTVSLRASTVKAIEHDLREFGTWLADTHPEVGSCADLHREHIEAFKTWLCTHPTPRTGAPLNRVSIKNALINLHSFLTRITEWGYPNPPVRPLLFPGDLPIIDKPLPRFLDDAAAAKLLRAARADPDPLSRLIVELLARTGIRKRRTAGPHRRRRRADRLRLLAAGPDRQTAQRPLHSAAPTAETTSRRLDHSPPANRPAHVEDPLALDAPAGDDAEIVDAELVEENRLPTSSDDSRAVMVLRLTQRAGLVLPIQTIHKKTITAGRRTRDHPGRPMKSRSRRTTAVHG